MVSLMQYRAAVGLHNIYMKAKEHSSRVRGKFWFTLLEAMQSFNFKKIIRWRTNPLAVLKTAYNFHAW